MCLWLVSLLCLLPCSASAQVTHGPPRIRNVYIPADQLEVLFGSSSKGVLMPREKILALWEEAQRQEKTQTVPPADAVLSQAAYEAHLEKHELRVTGRIQIAKLRGDWQTVALPFGGVAIESAQLDGQPARFGRNDDGTLFLLLKEEGRAELQLEMSAPLASKGGDLATTLKLPPAPASEIVVRLDEGKQLHLGETTLQPESTVGGAQVFRVAVDHTGLVPLVLSDRFARGNRAPLVLVNSRSIGHVEPAGLRWEIVLDLDVCARAADVFQLRLPESVDIAEVESPELDRWTVREEADGTATVAIAFRKPLLGRRAVRLLGLAPIPLAADWNFPTVKVLDAASHVGQVLLHPSPSLRVEAGTLAGIRPEPLSPASEGDAAATSGKPMAFAFWDESFQLPLRVVPRQRTLQASVASLVEVSSAGLALRSSVVLEPRYAPVFGVELQLSRGWDVASVLSAGAPVEWELAESAGAGAAADASPQTVRFDLGKPLNPGESLPIELTAQRHPADWLRQDEGFRELPLPELRLADADEVEGTLLVQAPPDIELVLSDLSDELQPVAAEGSRSPSGESLGTALQYRYQDAARTTGRLQVRHVPAKVSAGTLAFVRPGRGRLDVHYQLDLHIRNAKTRQIRFTLPAAVGEKIQVTPLDSAARVIEQQPARVPAAGDKAARLTLWQIVLDRPVTGDLTLAIDLAQAFDNGKTEFIPFPKGPSTSATDAHITIPVLVLENVSRQSGIIALEAAGDQQIDCVPESLRDLDPADVPKPKVYVPSQRIVAAYHYPRLPYRLAISATHHPSEPVLTAVCESAEITSVAGREGRMRHQARFRLRSLNLQHVPVTLPETADLWTVLVDGEPVEVRRKQDACIVPLPAGQADSAGGARELTLLYETDSPRLANNGFWGRLRPPTVRQTAPTIDVTTLGATWSVHPPDGTDVVSTGGDFKPEPGLTRATLVSRLAEAIVEQSTSGLAWKVGGLVVALIIVGFGALVGVGQGCQLKLAEILVVFAVIGILIALLLPATQSAREAARRSQCSNNLKQISLALHNYHDTFGQFPPAAIGPHNVPRDRQFSWMVAILPFLEQQSLYERLRLDLPWDHPHNAAVLQMAPAVLFCPSDPTPSATLEGFPKTSYVAVTGTDSTLGSGSTRGVIGLDRGLRLDEITDGASNTIMAAEVTDGGPWFAGGVGTARRIDDWIEKKTWSRHPGGGNFVFADASVRFMHETTDPQNLRHMATAQGMDRVSDEDSGDTPPAARAPAAESVPALSASSAEPAMPAEKAEVTERLAQQPAAPQEQPPVQAPQPPVQPGERARLSLRVALETDGGPAIRFRREGGLGELVLGLQDRTLARTLEWLLVAAALLAAWIGRGLPGPRQAVAVVAGMAVPVGLSGLVPLAWTPLLDGLLLGSLAAGGLWLLLRFIAANKTRAPASTAAAMAIGVGILLVADAGLAEEKRVAEKPQATAAPARPRDLTLFIPYESDDDKPLDNTQVYLPHDEFLRLWKQARPDKLDHAPPGVRTMVSHAEYSGRLQDDAARFDGRLVIHHLDDEWAAVLLPLGDVALEKVEINGQPATLAGNDPRSARVSDPPRSARVSDPAAPSDRRSPAMQETSRSARVSDPAETPSRSARVSDPAETPDRRSPVISESRDPVADKPSAQSAPSPEKPAPPRQEVPPAAGAQPAIYLRQPGLHVVDVRFRVPVSRFGATGQMAVPLRPVPSGRLVFQLPADDLEVQVSGSPGGWRRQADNLVTIPLGSADELSIRWQPRRAEARGGQLVSVDQVLRVEVLDSGLHLHGKLRYRIQQGALSELVLRVPPDLAVQGVQGNEVADWSIETEPAAGPDPAAQRLVVSLKAELTTGADVDILCLRRDRQPTGTIGIHALEPLGVVRETGRVAIACSSHFRVRVDKADRIDQIDRTELELPQSSDGCALLSAYRYTARPWSLQLAVERLRPHVEVSDRTSVAVTARRATLQSSLTAEVTGAPIRSLGVRLPALLRLSQVRVPPGADWFIDRDGHGQRLNVELNEPAVGKLELAVSGSLARDSGQAEFVVPSVTVEEVQAQRGQLAIVLDDDLEAVLTSDGGARAIGPALLDSALRADGGRQIHYAFQYDSPPEDLRLRLSPAPSRLNGDVITVVSVREGAVAYLAKVDFEVRQAARSRFRIATPQWLGDDIELAGEHIRQIRSQATGQERTWEIELQEPVRGTYRVQLAQTLPLSDDGTVPAAIPRPLDVERSRSHVVLENLAADEIAATTTSGAAPISIAAVSEGLTDSLRRQAVAAYRITGDGAALVWQRRVRQQETALMASISLADLTTVVHADGRYRTRAAYNIRNFTLQFLELELPADSRIWSVHVSGQPVRPAKVLRQGRPLTLLPLEKTSAGDFSSKVVVIYSGDLGGPLGLWTQVQSPAPRIQSDVPVSRTLWTLLVPRQYQAALVKRRSNLEEVGAAYQQEERKLSFLDELRQMVQVASSKGKMGARSKAQYNLEKVGSALQDYAQQSAQVDAKNAAEVQQQAQQIEAEIKRLEEQKPDAKRTGGDADFYFEPLRQQPEGARSGADADRKLEKPSEPQDPGGVAPEQRRDRLREQAAEQLEKLQTPRQSPEGKQTQPAASPPAAKEQAERPSPPDGQTAPGAALPETGSLSLDLDQAFVGSAYHFRKLHGEPRLVVRARHEDLRRRLTAVLWAGLCLALAAAAIHGLRRPNAAAVLHRRWPWLAAVAGTAWLFLLPAGVFGLALLVTALCVLISRSQQRRAVDKSSDRERSNQFHQV
ncbi:MAG: DUF1559 domain-containing protein [Pirellulales bacterium]|nr:DUF1559 domain-containing protein [Pirellulales bacterium]